MTDKQFTFRSISLVVVSVLAMGMFFFFAGFAFEEGEYILFSIFMAAALMMGMWGAAITAALFVRKAIEDGVEKLLKGLEKKKDENNVETD